MVPKAQASLVAQTIKNLPALWEIQVPSLCQEDPLEKALAAHSSVLAWRIPRTEPAGASPWDCKELDVTESMHAHTHIHTLNTFIVTRSLVSD